MSDVPQNSLGSIGTPFANTNSNTIETKNNQALLWKYVTKLEKVGKNRGRGIYMQLLLENLKMIVS